MALVPGNGINDFPDGSKELVSAKADCLPDVDRLMLIAFGAQGPASAGLRMFTNSAI